MLKHRKRLYFIKITYYSESYKLLAHGTLIALLTQKNSNEVITIWLAITVFNHGTILSTGKAFLIDSFNVYLIVLTAFVGFTTSLFSAPYMAHEKEIGKLSDSRLKLYYSMYQGFMLAMYLVLTTNNMGIMWVAMEGATLATVLLVSLYRTPESIEVAWKYFILCGVGIAQALFGTILLYYAASQIGDSENALLWTVLHESAKSWLGFIDWHGGDCRISTIWRFYERIFSATRHDAPISVAHAVVVIRHWNCVCGAVSPYSTDSFW